MLKRKIKGGFSTLLVLSALIVIAIFWPKKENIEPKAMIHKVVVHYEAGSKEMGLNEYIAGVLCNYENWLDLDNRNAEMLKVMSIYVRSQIAYVMQDKWTIEAEKLPFRYAGINELFKKYGSGSQEKMTFIRENVIATNGVILEKDGKFVNFEMDFAKILEKTKAGAGYTDVFTDFFQNYTLIVEFL